MQVHVLHPPQPDLPSTSKAATANAQTANAAFALLSHIIKEYQKEYLFKQDLGIW